MFSSNLNQIRIDKNYVKNISITKIKNNIEVKFYLNQPLNLNYFSITPQDKKGHRFVVDLTTDKIIYTKKINNTITPYDSHLGYTLSSSYFLLFVKKD